MKKIDPGTLMYYTEEGRYFTVEVLEDRSNDKEESYMVKILANLGKDLGVLLPEIPVGTVFEAMSARAYPCYKSWELSDKPMLPGKLDTDVLDFEGSLTIGDVETSRYLN